MNNVEGINGGYCEPPSGFEQAVEPKVVDDVPWWKGGPNAGLAAFGKEMCEDVWESRGIRPPDGVGCWIVGRMCLAIDGVSQNEAWARMILIARHLREQQSQATDSPMVDGGNGQQEDRDAAFPEVFTAAQGEEEDNEQETMSENTNRTISDAILEADEFVQIELPEREVFLAPWLKERSIALVSGPRGVGKTMFGVGLAEAIVRCEPFGPWKARESVPCLYLDGEMTVQDIQERLCQLNHTSDRKSPLYIYSDAYASHLGMPRAHLVSEEWRTKMKQILLAKGVKVWVVDNLASLTAGIDENSKKDWDPINAWLLELRFAGIATVMLHHTGKGGAQRGTSAREDNLDVSILLKRPSNYKPLDGVRFVVKFEKARVRTRYLPSLADVEFRLTEDEQGRGVWVCKSAKGKTKVEVLKRLNEGLYYDVICEETGLTKGRISQIKKDAVEKGWMDKKGKLTEDGLRFVYSGEDG